jgi:hypothetical protein
MMTDRMTRVSLAAVAAVLFLSGAAVASPLGSGPAALLNPASLDRPIGFLHRVAKKNKCPKGEVMQCQKISAEMKRLGWTECRCVIKKGRSGH